MSYKRVLLVDPPSKGEWKGFRPHIGLGYLAQALVENGIDYDVLDMNLGHKLKHLQAKIDGFKPDLIGFSLLTLEYKKFYQLINAVKEKNKKVKIAVGG